MSKNHVKSKAAPAVAPIARDAGVYINSAGHAYPIEGLSPLLPDKIREALTAEWANAGHPLPEQPAPPTYQAENAAGETVPLPHDETTLETDADRAAWAAYQSRLAAWRETQGAFDSEVNKRLLRAVCLCVKVDLTAEEEWVEEQEALGLPLPEKKAERRITFVETHVFKNMHDIVGLMNAVMTLSGIADERTAAAAEKAFRAAMDERLENAAAGGPATQAG